MTLLKTLPSKGNYTLIIQLNAKTRLKMPKLGCFTLQKGYYAYTGSALGDGATSLTKRIARHLKKRKTRFWHIDFLLSNKNAKITAVVGAETRLNQECKINDLIKNIEEATLPASGFGASDCKQNCRSHLVHLGDACCHEKIVDVYTRLFRNEPFSMFTGPALNSEG